MLLSGISDRVESEPVVAVAGLSSATADRILAARLGYTSAQRGAGSPDRRTAGDGLLLSFAYRVFGCSTGVHEGVLLGPAAQIPLCDMADCADQVRANLLKVTRLADGPCVPGQTHTERSRQWTIVRRAARARELLPLGPTYEDTLGSLGRHTRRNIRSVRKLASESRLTFAASTGPKLISASDHATLARRTQPIGVPISLCQRLQAHADGSGRPFHSVVRTLDGKIVSYVCGYFGEPASAYLLYQLNDPAFNALSPSLLHRAHLIEWLTERGCDELVFVHGCTGVLQHACVRQPLQELLVMRRTPVSYLAASPIAFAKAESSLGRLVRAAVLPAA